jgi:predicted GNAT family acetyltransferase
MISAEEVTVSQYHSPEEFKDFQCEKQGYCDFVKNEGEALLYQTKNLGVTYVFKYKGSAIGYVTLAMGDLDRKELDNERQAEKPFRNVPSLLLGHMARDLRLKGQGVGRVMVDFTFDKADEMAQQIGCRYVIVDAERDKLERYRLFGFESIPYKPEDRTVLMFFDLGMRKETA